VIELRAGFVREIDLIEQWGGGVPGIFREAIIRDLPEPTIEELGMRVRFTVYLNEAFAPSAEQSGKSSQKYLSVVEK
jgi:ATP-dependent DNA helicase RecG